MTFNYNNSFQSISNLACYPKDDPIIKYSDSVKSNIGYTIEKVYLNFMAEPMVVCRRDGVNVLIPPEPIPNNITKGLPPKCFIILTYHRFGKNISRENSYHNRYEHSKCSPHRRAQIYANEIDELSFTENLIGYYVPKENNVAMLNTVITEDVINQCEGGFYSFEEDITIALSTAHELQHHPFNNNNGRETWLDTTINQTSVDVRINDCGRTLPDFVYYMVGNIPCKINVTRDCLFENGINVVYKDAYSKKVTKHHYPIEDIVDGSHGENIDFGKPVIYRSYNDALNYGRGDDVVKNIVSKLKLEYEVAKNDANKMKFDYDERCRLLDIEKSKFDEESRKVQQQQKIQQDELEHKIKMEEIRLKQQREDAISREKQQSEYWKGIIGFATGIVGFLVLVLKK